MVKYLTGLRQQDMLALMWSDITESGIKVVPQKTKDSTSKKLCIKLTPELSSLIYSLPARGTHCFTTRSGTPYTKSGFSSSWKRVMARFVSKGNERFHEHDIRGKTATPPRPSACSGTTKSARLSATSNNGAQRLCSQ